MSSKLPHVGWNGHLLNRPYSDINYKTPRQKNLNPQIPEYFKNIPARLREWLAEILCHSGILGCAAEHFEGDSLNLARRFLHNSVDRQDVVKDFRPERSGGAKLHAAHVRCISMNERERVEGGKDR